MEDEFRIEDTALEIHCPACGNEMVHDGDSLRLAESPRGAMLECGRCGEISQWEFTLEPRTLRQVPVTWGGSL